MANVAMEEARFDFGRVVGQTFGLLGRNFVLFFLLLFGLRDWWKQVDLARVHRWQMGTILVSGGLGWILPALFIFPQTSGMLWAAAISPGSSRLLLATEPAPLPLSAGAKPPPDGIDV